MNGLQFPEQLQVLYVYKNEGSHLIRGNKTNWVGCTVRLAEKTLVGTVLSCEKTSESETDRSTWSWSTISQLSVLSFLLLFDHWIKSKAGP